MNRPLPPIPVTRRESGNSQQPHLSNFTRRITVPPPPPIDPPPPPVVSPMPDPHRTGVERSRSIGTCSSVAFPDWLSGSSQVKPRPRVPRMGTSVPISLINSSPPTFHSKVTPERRMLSPDRLSIVTEITVHGKSRRFSDGGQHQKTSRGQSCLVNETYTLHYTVVPSKTLQKTPATLRSDDPVLKQDQAATKNASLLPSLRLPGVSTASNICKMFRRNRLSVKSGRLTPISERTYDSSLYVNRRSQFGTDRSETSSECSDATGTTNLSFTWPLSRSHGEIYRSLSVSAVDDLANQSGSSRLKSTPTKSSDTSTKDSTKNEDGQQKDRIKEVQLPSAGDKTTDNPAASSSLPNALELWTGSIDSEEVLRRFKRMRMITLTARRWTMKRRPDGTSGDVQNGKTSYTRVEENIDSRKTGPSITTDESSQNSQSSSSNSSAPGGVPSAPPTNQVTPGQQKGHRSSLNRKKSSSPRTDAIKLKSLLSARFSSLGMKRTPACSKLCSTTACDELQPSRRTSEQFNSHVFGVGTRCSRVPHRHSLGSRMSGYGCAPLNTTPDRRSCANGLTHHHHADFHLRCLLNDTPCPHCCCTLGVCRVDPHDNRYCAGESTARRRCTFDGYLGASARGLRHMQMKDLDNDDNSSDAQSNNSDTNGTKLVTMLVV